MLVEDNISILKGVGEKTQKLFQKVNITTLYDLIHYYPRDYEEFGQIKTINQLQKGQTAAVAGYIMNGIATKRHKNLNISTLSISDNTGILNITFFNMPFLKNILKKGMYFVFRGNISTNGFGLVLEQPKYYSMAEYDALRSTLQPLYPLTKGLTNKTISKAVEQALYNIKIDEFLPENIIKNNDLLSYKQALYTIHFPKNKEDLIKARKRIAFNEFFTFILTMQVNKDLSCALPNNFKMYDNSCTTGFMQNLPFELTRAQKRVWQEIRDDVYGDYCMNRLIQGDVGSGKTIIAFLALLLTVSSGFQGALMAPTEVLAKQHYESFQKLTEEYNLPFKISLLVGSVSAKNKKEIYNGLAKGDINLIIGTNALIQEKVQYKNLAMVITDEQHRFGVRQREMLVNKGDAPHVLVMSATPIPRTLAIILYGDLKISVIDELPSNRLPIKNCIVNTAYRPKAYSFIEKQVKEGRQAYVICPMVESGDSESDLENVIDYTEKLRANLSDDIKISYLHGKMKADQKNQIMEDFANQNIDVLVSTTVIEVGINVPNATVMMVENSERFGLASLHQLRGRVGRGEHQSYCIFINSKDDDSTNERLKILNNSNDGFYIASEDLKLRGPGEMFGIRQSGEFNFKVADIYTDSLTLSLAKEAVSDLLSKDYNLSLPENEKLRLHLTKQLSNNIDFRTI